MGSGAGNGNAAPEAGECCDAMRGVLASSSFEPLISIEDDGGIYLTVGLNETDDGSMALFDHVMHHCPFCGTKLFVPEQPGAGGQAS